MSNFDLNIQNYSQTELEEIFDLKQGYQMNQLLENESKLIESITKDKEVTEKVKKETQNFIEKAKSQLVNNVSPTISNFDLKSEPTMFPQIYMTILIQVDIFLLWKIQLPSIIEP